MLLTGSQRETVGTSVPLLFHPPDETKLPVARVVVYDTILLLNIFMNIPSSQNRSNCSFRYSFLRLATTSTAKSGLNIAIIHSIFITDNLADDEKAGVDDNLC